MKRILVCLDGTWNSSGKEETGSDTNVLKLYRMAHKHDGPSQVSGYFAGVGTSRFEKITGGLFGIGLFDQIKDGYQFIVNQYKPGDQVIITGFSRGAFSARCLAGFVATCGVLKSRVLDLADLRDREAINDLWSLYKHRSTHQQLILQWTTLWQRSAIPWILELFPQLESGIQSVLWAFHGKCLRGISLLRNLIRTNVVCWSFWIQHCRMVLPKATTPLHWMSSVFRSCRHCGRGRALNDGSIHQVWFAGSHSNVGGGFANTGLSDIALDWMIRRLRASHGLEVDDVLVKTDGVWQPVELTTMDKTFGKVPGDKVHLLKPREVPADSRLHPTADLRIKGSVAHPRIPTHAKFGGSYRVDPAD